MAVFQGFPTRSARYTPIPNLFFTAVLPLIDDAVELKVTLGLFWRLSWKRGSPRFVTLKELQSDLDLMSGLASLGPDATETLQRGLRQVVARGAFLALDLEGEGAEQLYFLNTDADRLAIERVRRGELDLGGMPRAAPLSQPPERRDIFVLYENVIGHQPPPLILEELKEVEADYPPDWVQGAFREAERLNVRRWAYVRRILENWKAEGRPNGRPQRNTQEAPGAAQAPRRGGYIVKRKP